MVFEWNVDPELLHIWGPFGIRYYGLMFIIGFDISFHWMKKRYAESGFSVDPEVSSLLNHIVIGTLVGARLGHCLFYDPIGYLSNPLSILKVWEGGLASHGGYIGVFISVFWYLHKVKGMNFLWLMDRVAPMAVMTGGFIRLGNLFNSEIIGRATDGTFGVIFKRVEEHYPGPRHPTQLYESFGYFLTAAIVVFLFHRFRERWPVGRFFGLCMVIAWSWRFGVEFFKEVQENFEEGMVLNMGQLLSIPMILIGLLLVSGKILQMPALKILYTSPNPIEEKSSGKGKGSGKKKR